MDKIGIVILNYRTYQMTIDLITNLQELDVCNNQFEIVVVDNNSENNSSEKIREFINGKINIHFIQNTKNAGYASGNNIGLKYCYSIGLKYALVSNNDIEIQSLHTLQDMMRVMEEHPKCAVVSPRIISKEGKIDPPIYFRKPGFKDLTYGIFANRKERFSFDEKKICKIYAPRGSFMLLDLYAINKIDYLDENTFLYYEEPILAERLLLEGFECWHCGVAVVIHNHGKTISSVIKKKKTCQILCSSMDYYLNTYMGMNAVERKICLVVRAIVFMRRK